MKIRQSFRLKNAGNVAGESGGGEAEAGGRRRKSPRRAGTAADTSNNRFSKRKMRYSI